MSSVSSSSSSHRSRYSASSNELRELQYNSLFSTEEVLHDRKGAVSRNSRRSRSSHSNISNSSGLSAKSKNYCRKLGEYDYEVKSSSSSSVSSSSLNSYSTRRSSRRSHSQSDEESVISGLSSVIELGCVEEVTPQSKYGLRSSKDYSIEDISNRTCSLPSVCFANSEEIWDLMCKMDLKYQRNPNLFKFQQNLGPQMRAILLDWIMDVCEAYKMHRETLYLAIDYLDRYLAIQKNVPKAHLQLIGKIFKI